MMVREKREVFVNIEGLHPPRKACMTPIARMWRNWQTQQI